MSVPVSACPVQRRRFPAPGQTGKPIGMRTMFAIYIAVIVAGIAVYAAVGLSHS
jgi:hypothetical protein